MNVSVVAAGELARSPRMVNHARELARNGFGVTLIGYRGRQFAPPEGVQVVAVPSFAPSPGRQWSLWHAGMRMARVFAAIYGALRTSRADIVLVQNPPAFPVLAAWLLGLPTVLDWHNYGYSLLALRTGKTNTLAEHIERMLGRLARHHLCVSEGMRADLHRRFGITAHVLYDRPLSILPSQLAGRPLTVVCPAGWTADENMEMLLDAIELLGSNSLEFHLTGDGPDRHRHIPRMEALGVHSGYLPEVAYQALLGRADLGLSMHRSSSGLDLAMKVVDLFAAGVPVCAFDYGEVLREQVQPGETGFLFRDAAQLAEILTGLDRDPSPLSAMRACILDRWQRTWTTDWERVALPLFGGQA